MAINPEGRNISQPPQGETETLRSLSLWKSQVVKGYPEKYWRGQFDNYILKTVQYQAQDLGKGTAFAKHLFEMGNESRLVTLTDSWTLDLAATGVNMSTRVGGLIDTIAFVNGREYLVWAFFNDNFQWAGMGITRKPYSAFSAISTGSAPLGATRNFTVADAFQFTVGARVAVRNGVGTAPQFEWNWGTIQDPIPNSTTLSITMDNSVYGNSITGVTAGEILQWDMFRPWIVGPSSQTLYTPYYSLVGEMTTEAATGNITRAYRADSPARFLPTDSTVFINQTGAAVALGLTYLGRYIPLWANSVQIAIAGNRTMGPGPSTMFVYGQSDCYLALRINALAADELEQGVVALRLMAALNWSANYAGLKYAGIGAYTVESGMRG